ncbi:MAG: zinc-binding dehydrogenase [Archaeoglobus sp.]|nr:zinc-binding dehydrogenase [Archaeoglobus sp.]
MKAFVMKRVGEVGFMDKPIPEVGPYDALIKTTNALICTSNIHEVEGRVKAMLDKRNVTLGHEAVGVVEKVGSHVKIFKAGDRVAVGGKTPNWLDPISQLGHSSHAGGPMGGHEFELKRDGVFAEYFLVTQADGNLAHIPDSVSDEAAVFAGDILTTGIGGAENANIPAGGTAAVFGAGPVGLICIAGCRLLGAGLVIAVEAIPKRKELAKYYGADVVIDFREEDPVERILAMGDGVGIDSAIEAVGTQVTFESCLKVTRPGGTVSNVGYHGGRDYVGIPVDAWLGGIAEKTITSIMSPGGRERLTRMLRLIENGRVDPTKLISHRFKFDDIEKGFKLLQSKDPDVLKVLIEFGG